MIQEYQLRVLPEVAANEQRLKEYLIHEKGLNAREITAARILKRSIDARQRTIYVNLNVRAYLNEMPKEDEYQHTLYNNVEGKPQVIVVGAGPGGLFAALRLIELGLRPVIVERGKDVRERKKDLAQISRQQLVNPESNYSFGEGGAGAYSDGKLYTRSKKRGNVDKILNVFCQHGASTSILVDAHPHIGTDKLPRVIENMRNTIIQCGGEVHFETRMDALLIEKDEVKVRAYLNEMPKEDEYQHTLYNNVEGKPQVIVVGAGPGGLFAALRLIELGLRPVIVERGKDVRERKKDLAQISRQQLVNPESNYSFGEGGAGAYSDGKLYTRSKKRGNVDKILNVFCQHGASTSILVDAHPHIGTDKLPRVIENMRNTIIQCGGEVHFETRMDALLIEKDEVKGIETNTGKTFLGPVILATGHSARDVYRWLAANNVEIEAKGIAVGVRLEHPATLIDQIQYHNRNGRGKYLPAAEYSFVNQVDGRGVYSFCMCPGGFVVPAASGPEQIVVNGMSPSNRGSRWSNSGMVVELRPEDIEQFTIDNLQFTISMQHDSAANCQLPTVNSQLSMMYFQEYLERLCWQQGNMKQTAPAQRMADFTKKKLSYDLPETSYAPGLVSSPLHFWMPSFIAERLSKGFQLFGKYSRGFLTNEATMIGVETRTSAPVRITRDKETLQHVRVKGLFPCGEGAGYAGGIVSAGIDGERCAEAAKAFFD